MSSKLEEALSFKLKASNYLYALCDFQTLLKKNLTLTDFINLCKKKDVKLIQYRDKLNKNEIQIKNLQTLKQNLDLPIIINDKIELIKYADGLHLGQEDFYKINKDKKIAIKIIRKKIANKLLGLSTHNELEILEANKLDLDMIGLGAFRSTKTKDIDNILGDKLEYLAKLSKHPVCAIGGVKIEDKIKNVTFNVVGNSLYEN